MHCPSRSQQKDFSAVLQDTNIPAFEIENSSLALETIIDKALSVVAEMIFQILF